MSSPSPSASPPAAPPSSPAIYMVGGAVRDALLGQPVQDRDWVVVGATPEYMLAQGFTPVGKDFPVFLHPETHEEYALARTERKSGHGYKGFTIYAAPQVTLEEDLARRDLTINAIAARTEADGRTTYIDPFGGRADLAARVLRHVGPAFAEDPLRILRLARFAARFADFRIADETLALARQMVDAGEVAHLVPERVWQEIARGLMEPAPGRMLLTLRDCGALAVVLPEIDNLWQQSASGFAHAGEHALHMLRLAGKNDGESDKPNDCSAVDSAEHSTDPANPNNPTENSGETCGPAPLAVRYACLVHPLDAAARAACARRLKIPADVRELADLAASQASALRALEQRITQGFRQEGRTHNAQAHTAGAAAQSAPGAARALAEDVVAFFERCDAWRRPQRFVRALQVCALAAEPADAESAASAPSNARAANMANPANTANTANTVAIPAAHRTLLHALQVAQAADTAAIAQTAAREGLRGPEIGQRIQQARAQAVESSVLNYQSID